MLLLYVAPLSAQTPDVGPTVTVEYDSESGGYVKVTRVGDMVIDRQYMTFEEYQDYQMTELMKKYWNERSASTDSASDDGLLSRIPGFSEISKKVDGLLAIPDISINPTGSIDLTFQIVNNFRDDPQRDANLRSITRFDFDENIQVSMNAKIGDLFDFDINWNTKATFNFENKIKLQYAGKEDDIVQLFEAANISFPLNTTLIHGSQELFGVLQAVEGIGDLGLVPLLLHQAREPLRGQLRLVSVPAALKNQNLSHFFSSVGLDLYSDRYFRSNLT